MFYQTQTVHGLLLKQVPLGEYDEKLTFFTLELGKIELTSFGSRSTKSKRRALLSTRDFLSLEIETHRSYLCLKAASRNQAVLFSKHRHAYPAYTAMLSHMAHILPFKAVDKPIYHLLLKLHEEEVLKQKQHFLFFYLNATLLKICGLLNSADGCSVCGNNCSLDYVFTHSADIVGVECLLKIEQGLTTNLQKRKQQPIQQPTTNHKLATRKKKGNLPSTTVVAKLSHIAMAYLGFFVKQQQLDVLPHAAIYEKEFIKKGEKQAWTELIKLAFHMCRNI